MSTSVMQPKNYAVAKAVSAAVAGVGLVLLIVAAVLGFSPVHSGGIDCGTAFSESRNATTQDFLDSMEGFGFSDHEGACDDATTSRKTVALAIGIPGALLFLGGGTGLGAAFSSERSARAEARGAEIIAARQAVRQDQQHGDDPPTGSADQA